MHELRIVKDLWYIVSRMAERENISIITQVNTCFGQIIGIVPDIF